MVVNFDTVMVKNRDATYANMHLKYQYHRASLTFFLMDVLWRVRKYNAEEFITQALFTEKTPHPLLAWRYIC